MKLRNDDGDGIENVTIQMNLRFSKLSGCDLNVKYRWISLERNSWRPQASSNRQTIVVACIRSPWKIKRWLMKFHVAVVQLGVHLVEFLVLLRFTFPVPVVGAENTKKSPARALPSRKILSRLVGTSIHLRAFLHAMMSVMSGKNFNIKIRIYLRSAWHKYILVGDVF